MVEYLEGQVDSEGESCRSRYTAIIYTGRAGAYYAGTGSRGFRIHSFIIGP